MGSKASGRPGLEVRVEEEPMPEATAIALPPLEETTLLDRGKVGVICLIFTEIALFSIFLTAYVFYIGKSLNGPYPKDVLTLPIWATICLLSSSATVEMAIRSLRKHQPGAFKLWLGLTILLGAEFLHQTAVEWHKLIPKVHLPPANNLFGTIGNALVGL